MKKKSFKNFKKGGYALLFTIIIIGVVSAVTAGVSNSSYKQMILSSLARDSQVAFYQADTALDCALYADLIKTEEDPNFFITNEEWECGGSDLSIAYSGDGFGSYLLSPPRGISKSTNPCFNISVKKDDHSNTEIEVKGYNICDKNNPRVVERAILINY